MHGLFRLQVVALLAIYIFLYFLCCKRNSNPKVVFKTKDNNNSPIKCLVILKQIMLNFFGVQNNKVNGSVYYAPAAT